jgi:histidine triad (HIT) family protein
MAHFAYRLIQLNLIRPVIQWIFAHMSFLIPTKRLRETDTLLAFRHPRPSYPLHILLVSKRPYRTLMDIQADDGGFLFDVIETTQSLVREFDLERGGYRLITNGGAFQDVPQLHFHLIADTSQIGNPL